LAAISILRREIEGWAPSERGGSYSLDHGDLFSKYDSEGMRKIELKKEFSFEKE